MAKKRVRVTPETASRAMLPDNVLMDLLDVTNIDEVAISMIPIDLIDPNRYQPRKHFDSDRLEELATSIRASGFLGVLLARQSDDRYEIAFGERRLRASKLAGLKQLPLYVKEFTDIQMMEVAVTENVNREDLTPVEEAEGYQMLSNAGYSYRKLSERIGKSTAHISRALSLLKYGDIQDAVGQSRITATAAYEIAKVEEASIRSRLIDQVARDQLNLASLQEAIRVAKTTQKAITNISRSNDQPVPMPELVLPELPFYDPMPNLRSAVRQLKNIRSDRFDDVPPMKLEDVVDLLDEILFRTRSLKESIEINQKK